MCEIGTVDVSADLLMLECLLLLLLLCFYALTCVFKEVFMGCPCDTS